jgi:predicted glycosyltransferase
MNVRQLIEELQTFPQDKKVLVSCDEELNTVFEGFEVCLFDHGEDEGQDVLIFPLSGTEIEE